MRRLAAWWQCAVAALCLLAAPAAIAGTVAPLAHAELSGDGTATVVAADLRASLAITTSTACGGPMLLDDAPDTHAPEQCHLLTLQITEPGHPPQRLDLANAEGMMAPTVSLYRLDNAATAPQIMVSAYSGGAHCCEVSALVTRDAQGQWRGVALPAQDDDRPPAVIDPSGAGRPLLVTHDQRFLYTFASHAGSFMPLVLQRFHDGHLDTVTRDPANRAALADDLARSRRDWEGAGRPEPNGFYAYAVATAANLGELAPAWRDMLAHAGPGGDDFGVSPCLLRDDPGQCTQADRKTLPFAQGLALFLVHTGYLTPDQARDPLAGAAATQPPATPQAGTPARPAPSPADDGHTIAVLVALAIAALCAAIGAALIRRRRTG